MCDTQYCCACRLVQQQTDIVSPVTGPVPAIHHSFVAKLLMPEDCTCNYALIVMGVAHIAAACEIHRNLQA